MEQDKLKIIRGKRPQIVRQLGADAVVKSVIDELVSRGALSSNEQQDALANAAANDKVRCMLDHLERKPGAFNKFLDSLWALSTPESNHLQVLAQSLDPYYKPSNAVIADAAGASLKESQAEMNTHTVTAVATAPKQATSPITLDRQLSLPKGKYEIPKYDMKLPLIGHAVICNIQDFENPELLAPRSGSEFDRDVLRDTFKQLKFEVKMKENLSSTVMKRLVLEFAHPDKHTDSNCFVFAILSHGEDGAVFGTDGGKVDIQKEIIDPIQSCSTLAGKPKIFIFQACRGKEADSGVQVVLDTPGSQPEPPCVVQQETCKLIPTMSDVLVAFASVKGFAACRIDQNDGESGGTWFIQHLADVIKENYERDHIVDMLTLVNHKMSKQTGITRDKKTVFALSNFTSTLTKKLYLKLDS